MELYYVYKGRRKKVKHDMNRLNQWISYKRKQYVRIGNKTIQNMDRGIWGDIYRTENTIESLQGAIEYDLEELEICKVDPTYYIDEDLKDLQEHLKDKKSELQKAMNKLTQLQIESLTHFRPTRRGMTYLRKKYGDDFGDNYINAKIESYKNNS